MWSHDQDQAFHCLKQWLIQAPTLAFLDFAHSFILHTDACKTGLVAVFTQESNKVRLPPTACASKMCTKAWSIYSITEMEELVVVWTLKYFTAYIITPIKSLFTQTTRLYLGHSKTVTALEKFTKWFHHPGFWLTVPVCSLQDQCHGRCTIMQSDNCLDCGPFRVWCTEALRCTKARSYASTSHLVLWSSCGNLLGKPPILVSELFLYNGLLCLDATFVVPSHTIQQNVVLIDLLLGFLYLLHSAPHVSHPGTSRCYKQARICCCWPKMQQSITEYIAWCPVCQARKGSPSAHLPVLQYSILTHPCERVHLDIISGFPILCVGIDTSWLWLMHLWGTVN